MAEWFKATVLKTVVRLRLTVSSNLTPSASARIRLKCAFAVEGRIHGMAYVWPSTQTEGLGQGCVAPLALFWRKFGAKKWARANSAVPHGKPVTSPG